MSSIAISPIGYGKLTMYIKLKKKETNLPLVAGNIIFHTEKSRIYILLELMSSSNFLDKRSAYDSIIP